jgi:hypothetical protein
MNAFFAWLSTPGPFEEILLVFVLLIILGFIGILIAKGLVDCDIKGVKVKSKDKEKPNDKPVVQQEKPNKSDLNNSSSVLGANVSILATQDYRIISLIIQAHSNRIREEMKQYCSVNGLDKKDRDSYMIYVDEKKNLYISELKEMFNREYVSYDIISISDIYEIIEESKERMMNKLEKLYIKLRDISIEEHTKINESKKELFETYLEKALEWRGKTYSSDKEVRDILIEYLNQYHKTCENLTINERIDVLNKQVQKIDTIKKDLVDIFLTEVIKKMNNKLKS